MCVDFFLKPKDEEMARLDARIRQEQFLENANVDGSAPHDTVAWVPSGDILPLT